MAPRSALDVLVDLNDQVTSGKVGEYQPVPLGFTPARQDDRRRPARRRAAADRWRPGHRQDDDGPPDGPQRRLRRPGQRPVHLLRARGAVPPQPAHRDGVGARPPAPQDRRDQDPGRPQGDPRHLDGRGRGGAQLANNPRLRPSLDRIARYGQNLFLHARLADGQHVDNIRNLVRQHRELSGDRRLFVVVDYLQKVPVNPRARRPSRRR